MVCETSVDSVLGMRIRGTKKQLRQAPIFTISFDKVHLNIIIHLLVNLQSDNF